VKDRSDLYFSLSATFGAFLALTGWSTTIENRMMNFIKFDIIMTLNFRMSALGLPEQYARYFPTESEAGLLVPHLIEYFKHRRPGKTRKDETATTVRIREDLHLKKWTRRRVRMSFQNNENRYRPVQIDDHMNAGFAPVSFRFCHRS
jgi:hypothetical protein